MKKPSGKNILQRVLEGIMAIALVLLFFVILIVVFEAVFPEGSGLRFIFETPDRPGGQRQRDSEIKAIRPDSDDDLLFSDDNWAATLTRTRNSVKSKKADDIAWKSASRGMQLQNRDAVQTLEDSSAAIRFDAENHISLGENSLIVIRRMEKDLLFKEKRSFMVVVDGELRGRINSSSDSDVYLEVETPNAVARLKANPQDAAGIDFKVDVLEDDSSAVTIYSGAGEVEARGETVLLGENQLTRIDGEMAPTAPVTLPEPAAVLTPRDSSVFRFRSLPPRVRLSWAQQEGVEQYHLLLAEDADFTRILVDKKMVRNEFMHGNLREGDYFWKVSSINFAGESAFSPVRTFSLAQDQLPPPLEVRFPDEIVHRQEIRISGSTEPAARVYISGQQAAIDDAGNFRHGLSLERGINIVVVEAVDRAGNVSYQSKVINGKY